MSSLARIIQKVRDYTSDPNNVDVKFDDTKILNHIRSSWDEVVHDVSRVASDKVRVRIDIQVVKDVSEYTLPPNVGQFLEFSKIADNGSVLWEVRPTHPLSPYGPGWMIEGPTLRLDPVWTRGETMRITYVPNGEVAPHAGTGTLIPTTSGGAVTAVTEMALATPTPTTGEVDGRKNAYAGSILRILTAAGDWGASGATTAKVVQERIITGSDVYNNTGFSVTFSPSLDPLPGHTGATLDDSGTCTYEIVPLFFHLCEEAVALLTSRRIAAVTRDYELRDALNLEYQSQLRLLQSQVVQREARRGRRFERRANRSRY